MRAPSEAAFVNQALAMELPGLAPSGFNPHAFARSGLRAPLASGLRPFRAARSACLRPSPVPGCALRLPPAFACAPSCRTACPTFHVHQVAHQHRLVADRPNGLSAARPCLQRAFAAYPRPGEAGPAVFHGPIARGLALDSPGLPRPTDADEQTTSGSAFQIEGLCCARFADG